MCRSIKTLREPYAEQVTEADVHAAALQYVRKISGFRKPAAHNAHVFDAAVEAVARATQELLDHLEVRAAPHGIAAPASAGRASAGRASGGRASGGHANAARDELVGKPPSIVAAPSASPPE
jgi:hypothetical protein